MYLVSDIYSASVTRIMYAVSHYIGPRHNGTRLYLFSSVNTTCWIGFCYYLIISSWYYQLAYLNKLVYYIQPWGGGEHEIIMSISRYELRIFTPIQLHGSYNVWEGCWGVKALMKQRSSFIIHRNPNYSAYIFFPVISVHLISIIGQGGVRQ